MLETPTIPCATHGGGPIILCTNRKQDLSAPSTLKTLVVAMKVRSAVRRLCRDCYVVKKKGVIYIRCKTVKKHKQRQGLHTAAVETAEEVRDAIGAEVVNLQARLRGPWSASRETPSSGLNDDPVGGALHQLPWLPAWASSSEVNTRVVSQGLPTEPPLRALAAWGTSILSHFFWSKA